MNAPFIFIFLPAIASIVLLGLQRHDRVVRILGASAMLVLLLLAWKLPISKPIFSGVPGIPALVVVDSFSLFGRKLVFGAILRSVLPVIYLASSVWFISPFVTPVRPLFISLFLGISSLIVASMAVEPPLFSALFIVLAALLSIPLLSPPGQSDSIATQRLLIFQVVGMSLFLIADYLISSFQLDENPGRLSIAISLLGLGLAFMVGLFPFHTWLPMIASSSSPLAGSFVIFFIPFAATFLGFRYLLILNSSQLSIDIFTPLRATGILMIFVGGCWAAVERHLGRIMSFAMMIQVGIWLLTISLINLSIGGVSLGSMYFNLLVPQSIALVLWAISLEIFFHTFSDNSKANLRFDSILGLAYRFPILALGVLVANFSLAGLPLLANFPYLLLLSGHFAADSTLNAGLIWLGHACLAFAGLRSLVAITKLPGNSTWKINETKIQVVWLVLLTVALLALGILPRWSSFSFSIPAILTNVLSR